jgi:RNA polymerase-binding transcription factor DksA
MDQGTARALLQEERRRLEELLRAVSAQERPDGDSVVPMGLSANNQHPADLATDAFERARDVSIAWRLEGQLADVARALQRIDDGTFGRCEACGRALDEARLQALPAARFCLDDQELAEREAS